MRKDAVDSSLTQRHPVSRPLTTNPPRAQRGLWVVLLGPDGAGKSSVIQRIRDGHTAGFAGSRSYHLRPMLMWGQPLPSSYFDPHGQSTRGVAVSMLKLVYLLFANWIGYLLAVRPRLTKGDLVLFDRYFPDCLVDPRRYRLPASCRRAAELIAGLVPKPDLYVLLDAPARVLQQRKSEVPLSESERQRSSYEAQGAKLGNLVVVDARRPLAEVMDAVVNCIIDLRLARSTECFEAA